MRHQPGEKVHVGGQRLQELLLGLLPDADLDVVVEEVVVLQRGQVLFALLLTGLHHKGIVLFLFQFTRFVLSLKAQVFVIR